MATVTPASPAVNGREDRTPTEPTQRTGYKLTGTYQVVNGRITLQFDAFPFLEVMEWDAQIPMAAAESVVSAAPSPVANRAGATHAPGFATVNWYGSVYYLTIKQRAVIAMLWEAWQNGTPCVDTMTLMKAADSDGSRLRDVFDHGRHPAWNTLVVQGQLHGGRVGTWRLAPPPCG